MPCGVHLSAYLKTRIYHCWRDNISAYDCWDRHFDNDSNLVSLDYIIHKDIWFNNITEEQLTEYLCV